MPTEAREIFKNNLNELMARRGKTQADISRDLDVPQATVSAWCVGTKYPRIDAMQRLADYLGVGLSALISADGLKDLDNMDRLQALHEDPRLGMLFDRVRKMRSEDVDFMLQLSERIKREAGR